MTNSVLLSDSDWLSRVEAAARGDMAGDPDATKKLDEMGPADVILRLVEMVRWLAIHRTCPPNITHTGPICRKKSCAACILAGAYNATEDA